MKKILYMVFILVAFMACKSNDGRIEGTAKAGDVVAGITVNLYTMNASLHQSTTTNSQGEFVFSGLATGNYYIGATVEINGETYDTGNTPQVVYVSDEIVKEVSLSLSKK